MYPDLAWLPQGEIQSAALGDIQTRDNSLSVYKVESKEDADQVIVALAANRDSLANLDYAIFEDTTLVSTGVEIRQQDGETPHGEVNKLHYDIANLTVQRLAILAQAVAAGDHNRVPRKNIKARLQEAVQSGALDEQQIKPQLLQKIR